MDLLSFWQEKQSIGKIRFDADLLIIQSTSAENNYRWGTVFYSQAREHYKTQIKQTERKTTFDLELMRELQIAEFGNLVIAANPNSLFQGHLVIYPKQKSPELTFQDIFDITLLAKSHPDQTFICNMERSAASILDWAHYQSYPIVFPIEDEKGEFLIEFGKVKVARIFDKFPAYALVAESSETELLARWLLNLLDLFAGNANPHGQKVPCNFIWRKNRVWIIPRALNQSNLAATYFGGLEMGGIFCLPNADDFRRYLPDVLRKEISESTLTCEKETQKWFEENALRILCGTI